MRETQKTPAPLPTDGAVKPYAHEYGKSNGDGTYSVVIERGEPRNPVADWPVKPLFAHPPKPQIDAGAVGRAQAALLRRGKGYDLTTSDLKAALAASQSEGGK